MDKNKEAIKHFLIYIKSGLSFQQKLHGEYWKRFLKTGEIHKDTWRHSKSNLQSQQLCRERAMIVEHMEHLLEPYVEVSDDDRQFIASYVKTCLTPGHFTKITHFTILSPGMLIQEQHKKMLLELTK